MTAVLEPVSPASPALAPAAPSPASLLARHADGRLYAAVGNAEIAVTPRYCFPWSRPGRYVSLRDDAGREVILVDDVAALDEPARRALEHALAEQGFVFEVTRIEAVTEEVEIRHWVVETRQGRRGFQTRLDDWPRTLPDGGILIRDVAGDLYLIPDRRTLDSPSRDLLWAFVD